MNNLVVVNNLAEFEILLKNKFDFSDKTVLTTNIELSQKYSNEYKTINLWKYLDDAIIEKSETLTQLISESFVLPDRYKIIYKGVDVFDITKVFLRYFYKGALHSHYALVKMLTELNADNIFIIENKTKPINVVYFDNSHVLDGVCEYFFRERGKNISYFNFENPIVENKSSSYNFEPSDFRFDIEHLNNSKNTILFLLSENFEWDFELVKTLQKKHRNVFTILRTTHRESKHKERFENPVYFNDFSFDTKEIKGECEKIDKVKNSFFYNDSDIANEFPFIFKNRYLDFQFADFFDRLKLSLKEVHTFDRIYNFVKPGKVYFSNSWDMSVRCMIKSANNHGVETFATIHGGVVDNAGYLTRKLEVGNYLVWGNDNADGLVKFGQKPDSIKIVGSMQMDFWNGKLKMSNNKSTEKSEYDNIYNFHFTTKEKKEKPVIVFFTSAGGGFSGHSINEYYQEDSLKKIIDLAVNKPDIDFKIKPHILFDYFDFWEEVKNNLPANLEVMKEKDLMKACLEMDLGVLLNTISNVAYEISLAGKPVVFLKDAVFNCKCAESTIERGGIMTIQSFMEFEKLIADYFRTESSPVSDSGSKLKFSEIKQAAGKLQNDIRKDLEKRRVKFLNHALAGQDITVKERIENLIMKSNKRIYEDSKLDFSVYKIINWVQKSIKENKTLKFPEIKNIENLPTGKEMLEWVYYLTDNWCRYYNKNSELAKCFNNLLLKIPLEFGIDNKTKFKNNIYAKSRDLYLKYKLNENEKVRKLVKKVFK